jgi:dTDP-4-amino-4,6-dideoxygalactose transaminase
MKEPVKIPLLDLKAELATYRDAVMAAIERVVDSQEFILGPEVDRFEAALAAYTGLPAAIGVSSGTDALLVALMALDIGPGDEVVTTPFSFFATAGVVSRLRARPVFADIDPGTFNLTADNVRAAITPNTRAIIPVHLFGQMCDLGSLYEDANGPTIIEDAAQSLGARLHGRMAGAYGACAALSFFPSKNLGGFGDGGAVVGRDAALAEKMRILRVHGSKPKYYHHVVGGNFRLDALQAAVLSVKLPYLDGWAAARRRNAARYDEHLAPLAERGLVATPQVTPGAEHVYNQYVIRTGRRDELAAYLAARGIGTAVYYPRPLHLQPCFADLGYGPGDFPESERACAEVLALPVGPELTADRVATVAGAIREFHRA